MDVKKLICERARRAYPLCRQRLPRTSLRRVLPLRGRLAQHARVLSPPAEYRRGAEA